MSMLTTEEILLFMEQMETSKNNFRKNVLLTMKQLFGYHQMNFWLCDEKHRLYDPVTINTDEKIIDDYLTNFYPLDLLTPSKLKNIYPKKRVISLFDVKPKQELEKTEYYNSFLRKYRFYNNVGIFLVNNGRVVGLIDFVIEEDRKRNVSKQEMINLEVISRYLALQLSEHLSTEQKMIRIPEKYNLTEREKEVLDVVMQGYTNTEIAEKLYISVNTVKKHVQALYKKLGVQNRTSLTYKVSQFV